jgi:uncharacterized protein
MKIGDKVRFLSEVGGGIVTGFKGKDFVLVEDADGFDIPMPIRECVVIEVKVKITGNYVTTFDQMGLMLRIDHENWIKAGVEYVDGKQNVSAVVTHRTSDWSVVQLPDAPRSLWIKAVRRLDAVEIFFSRDDKEYTMIRTCWLQDNCPVMVGLMGACPDGKGFTATFEEFKVTSLADQRRLEWAKKQAGK